MNISSRMLLVAGLLLAVGGAVAEGEKGSSNNSAPQFVRENVTGRPLGMPPPIASTSPTKSETQADKKGGGKKQGSYTRISLRNRTRIN